MRTFQHQIQRSQGWGDLLVELAATAIAFAVIALATALFCWSFFIPYHWRYSVGAILATVMLKWIVPNLQRK
jgi:preprotein translocase subunit SecF